jgi:hypothetical protein
VFVPIYLEQAVWHNLCESHYTISYVLIRSFLLRFMSRSDPITVEREIKKRLPGKSLQREASTSMVPMETELTGGTIFHGRVFVFCPC